MPEKKAARSKAQIFSVELRAKYLHLRARFQKMLFVYRKNRESLQRLSRSYTVLKRKYLFLKRHSSARSRELMDKLNEEKYELVFDENRNLVSASQSFLKEIGMDKDSFSRSFYVDRLFERFLPQSDHIEESIDIKPFQFPVLITEEQDETAHIHPFLHLSIYGKLSRDPGGKKYFYYLNAENISSSVELNYFQKTDTLVSTLSIANLNLMKAKKTIEMQKTMLISLVTSIVGEYSKETSLHLRNIQILTARLSAECKRLGLVKVKDYDVEEYVKDINYTSVLHDIGKMAIPSEILGKNGLLTDEEMKVMRRHPIIGANYIKRIIDLFEDDPVYSSYVSFLRIPYEICRHHHERWDGKGYPDGLSGNRIPLPARIVSVVDTYEAIRGKRSYVHVQKTHLEATDIVSAESGKQFDPDVVKAFMNVSGAFADMH
jgi:HD-GYP domain-containing protein (c-di-GMP phosphodiesterase class II)